ncbi:MAG: dephospho-CoA kinase [Pseudomonadota bacterium]
MIVGLTGGIGSGKSEVSRRFQALGITVIDSDEVARQVVEPNSPALQTIAAHFGNNILNANGTLNRGQLRQIIFADAQEKIWLENFLHPIIRQETIRQLQLAKSDYVILASPLLLETTQHQLVNRVLVVDADEELQLTRASERDQNNREQIAKIMATQMSRANRRAKADDIIYNHGDLTELDEQVKKLHAQYLKLSQQI